MVRKKEDVDKELHRKNRGETLGIKVQPSLDEMTIERMTLPDDVAGELQALMIAEAQGEMGAQGKPFSFSFAFPYA